VEPPLGVARVAALLKRRGVEVKVVDLCAEGLDSLLHAGIPPAALESLDPGTRFSAKRIERSTALLKSPEGYENADRHKKAALDLGRVLRAAAITATASAGLVATITPTDYEEDGRSPLRRADLVAAAGAFRSNAFHSHFSARLDSALTGFPANTVGLSINFLSQALCAFAIIGFLRASYPQLRIVLGGGLVTSWAAQGLLGAGERFGGLVDAVLPGRGEDAFPAFLGLAAENGEGREAFPSAAPDFGDIDFSLYFAPTRVLPYNFATGCPWKRCTFCPEKAEDSRYRGLPPARALEEVDSLVRAYGGGLLHFTDNEISPAYLRALASAPPPLPWHGFARFSPELADLAFCRRLAAAGCRMLQLGLESGDQGVLDALGKGTRIQTISRILANLAEVGIGVYAYVLFGTPAEDRSSALVTRDFVAEHAGEIDFLNIAVFNMPAASEEVGHLRTRAFYEGDLSLYREFEHPAGWNRDEVRAFLSTEFEAEPSIRPIVLRTPAFFTSSHAPFLLGRAR
jgi:radical SAM superfamily enzyme YgiQ (UPF0313 family)